MKIPKALITQQIRDSTGDYASPGDRCVFHYGEGAVAVGVFLGYTTHMRRHCKTNKPIPKAIKLYFDINGEIKSCYSFCGNHDSPSSAKFIALRNIR